MHEKNLRIYKYKDKRFELKTKNKCLKTKSEDFYKSSLTYLLYLFFIL